MLVLEPQRRYDVRSMLPDDLAMKFSISEQGHRLIKFMGQPLVTDQKHTEEIREAIEA